MKKPRLRYGNFPYLVWSMEIFHTSNEVFSFSIYLLVAYTIEKWGKVVYKRFFSTMENWNFYTIKKSTIII